MKPVQAVENSAAEIQQNCAVDFYNNGNNNNNNNGVGVQNDVGNVDGVSDNLILTGVLFGDEDESGFAVPKPAQHAAHPFVQTMFQGNYAFLGVLGAGAFGTVHHCCSEYVGHFAVKYLNNHKEFDREVGALKTVSKGHPNVMEILDAFDDGTTTIIFLEYCDGGSLRNYIDSNKGKLPWYQVVYFTHQLFVALEFIHGLDVFHSDIKPDNLLLTSGGVLKLGDFGSSGCQSVTTVRYNAPEVFLKLGSCASDIWSGGCVTVEMAWKLMYEREKSPEVGSESPVTKQSIRIYAVKQFLMHNGPSDYVIPMLPDQDEWPQLHNFLCWCFTINPKERPGASAMLGHPFFSKFS